MKISITHTDDEAQEAEAVVAAVQKILPKGKLRRSDNHPPHRKMYITTPVKSRQFTAGTHQEQLNTRT